MAGILAPSKNIFLLSSLESRDKSGYFFSSKPEALPEP
jgi:hypothetical protein